MMYRTEWVSRKTPSAFRCALTVTDHQIPSFLKLHHESPSPDAETQPRRGEFEDLFQSFHLATGWNLRLAPNDATPLPDVWTKPLDHDPQRLELLKPDALDETSTSTSKRCLSKAKAQTIAGGLADMLDKLSVTRRNLWQREAELAAGVPVALRPSEPKHLADRIEAILQAGVDAVGGTAAAMYMLDEGTSELKLRALCGLSKEHLLDPARSLNNAVADLEALAGHAVVIEDAHLLPHWDVPLPFASAVCVPISSPSTPLGTLWLFGDRPRDYLPQETNIIEVVAGRLAAELEREMLLSDACQTRLMDHNWDYAVRWQQDRQPNVKPLLGEWDIAGWTQPSSAIRSDFFDWQVQPDGRLAVAVGSARGTQLEAALTSAALHSAVKSHGLYPHNSRQMLDRINETMWNSSAGGQCGAMFYGLIEPATGELECSIAGDAQAVLVRGDKTEMLCDIGLPLGMEPEGDYPSHRKTLHPADQLLVFGEGAAHVFEREPTILGDVLQAWKADCKRTTADDRVDLFGELFNPASGTRQREDYTTLLVRRGGR